MLVETDNIVSVYDIAYNEIKKEFSFENTVVGINFIDNDKNVLIADDLGNFSIIDLQTLEEISPRKKFTNDKKVFTIAVI